MGGISSIAQGQSAGVTEEKQRGLQSAFAINLGIFQAKHGNRPGATYLHVDLNAGCGINEQVQCIGSPLAFLSAAHAKEVRRFRAVFCDKNEDHVRSLLRRPQIKSEERAFVVCGDNAAYCSAVPHIVDMIGERRQYVIGSVLCDPNGTEIPIAELAALAEECPRMDILINLSATALKRNKHLGVRVEDIIRWIPKRYWLVRHPIGDWQWTMLIGRNIDLDGHAARGFHKRDTPIGQSIMERLSYTESERAAKFGELQLGLF